MFPLMVGIVGSMSDVTTDALSVGKKHSWIDGWMTLTFILIASYMRYCSI